MHQKMNKLKRVAEKIEQQVESAINSWRSLLDKILTFRPSEDAWSVTEVIGHLIDSASNNHHSGLFAFN